MPGSVCPLAAIAALLLSSAPILAAEPEQPPKHPVRAGPVASAALVEEVTALDRQLFAAVFDSCDADAVGALLDPAFEFMHDKEGLMARTPAEFVAQIRDSCRGVAEGRNVRARRELVPGSHEVHAVQGYGAIEIGTHRFYGLEPGRAPVLRETGRFFHVWHRGPDGKLRLVRSYSFDHRPAG